MSLIPIYTPGWRETKWSKVLCLRKKRDGQGLNPGSPDSEFEVLTTRPHTPTNFMMCTSWNVDFRSMQEAHLGFTNMDKPHLASCSHFKILHSPISSSPAISYSWEILVEVKAPMKKLNEQKRGMWYVYLKKCLNFFVLDWSLPEVFHGTLNSPFSVRPLEAQLDLKTSWEENWRKTRKVHVLLLSPASLYLPLASDT